MLKLMYITNRCDAALIAQKYGVDRIFIDMEYIGKSERQGGMDTVQNHHTVEDVKNLRRVITSSQLLVRVNPIHESSKKEIDSVIEAGADIIMLPMWRSAAEVKEFLGFVSSRAKTMLLLENKEAMECLDEVLELCGIDEIYIGLNDLHLSLKKRFLFELLCDGTVEGICNKLKKAEIPFGFGGFGRIGEGDLPAQYIVSEHYRLGSSCAILSRSFCNLDKISDENEIEELFKSGLKKQREYEEYLKSASSQEIEENHKRLVLCVDKIVSR
ncbi:MAG: aldolase/citrate lyase family protein [Eubacterium sp.]